MAFEEIKIDKEKRIVTMQSNREVSFQNRALLGGSAGEPIVFNIAVSDIGSKRFGIEIGIEAYNIFFDKSEFYYCTLEEAKILSGKLSEAIKKVEEREGDFVVIDGKKYKLTEVED